MENLLLFHENSLVIVQKNLVNKSLGDRSDGVTPGNISNPAVKSVSADGTWRATSWESRSLPGDFSFNIFQVQTFHLHLNHV